MAVQIYSMTSIADAIATAAAGADLIGVVVAEPGIVPEGVGAAMAREILVAIWQRAKSSPKTAPGFASASRQCACCGRSPCARARLLPKRERIRSAPTT